MNFFKLYMGDYQRDTAHLSLSEHGAYHMMLHHYYATEKPLPTGKALYRMLRAQDPEEIQAIESVVSQFWVSGQDGLFNERARAEIQKGSHQRIVNQEIGKLGGRPKKTESVSESQTETITEHITESVSETKPNDNPNQKPEKSKTTPPSPPLGGGSFEKFWAAYPKKKSRGAAEKAWKRVNGTPVELILEAIQRQKQSQGWQKNGGEFIPYPATWLNGKGWLDEPDSQIKPAGGIFDGVL